MLYRRSTRNRKQSLFAKGRTKSNSKESRTSRTATVKDKLPKNSSRRDATTNIHANSPCKMWCWGETMVQHASLAKSEHGESNFYVKRVRDDFLYFLLMQLLWFIAKYFTIGSKAKLVQCKTVNSLLLDVSLFKICIKIQNYCSDTSNSIMWTSNYICCCQIWVTFNLLDHNKPPKQMTLKYGEDKNLFCKSSMKRINILQVQYMQASDTCITPNAFCSVTQSCNGKQSCALWNDKSFIPSPCDGAKLIVDYNCEKVKTGLKIFHLHTLNFM